MTKANATPTTPPSRRTLLAAAAGAAALPLAAVPARAAQSLPPVAATPEAADPIVALAAEYTAIRRAQVPLTCEESTLRAALLDRYGAPPAGHFGWLHPAAEDDAQVAQLKTLISRMDVLDDRAAEVFETMMEVSPTTVAGVIAKLSAALRVASYGESDMPHEAQVCLAAMRDAIQVLSGGGGV